MEKGEHLTRMAASGCFRHIKEIVVHHTEPGNAERLVGLASSQGGLARLVKQDMSEGAIRVDEFLAAAHSALGGESLMWCFSHRVWVGIK
jgi:hypothetical protein